MLILFLPANVYAAIQQVPFGGHGNGPLYLLVRVPFQLLVIAWVWFSMGLRVRSAPQQREGSTRTKVPARS